MATLQQETNNAKAGKQTKKSFRNHSTTRIVISNRAQRTEILGTDSVSEKRQNEGEWTVILNSGIGQELEQ